MKTKRAKYTLNGYLRALALDNLSSHAHELSNTLDDIAGDRDNADELSAMFATISRELHNEARKHFPRYPHDDHMAGAIWARDHGLRI